MKLILILILLCALAIMQTACGQDQVSKAKLIASSAVVTIDELSQVANDLAAAGALTPAEIEFVKTSLPKVVTAIKTVNAKVQTYTTFDAHNRADLLKVITDAVAVIDDLKASGLLALKTQSLNEKATIAIELIRGGLLAVEVILGAAPTSPAAMTAREHNQYLHVLADLQGVSTTCGSGWAESSRSR